MSKKILFIIIAGALCVIGGGWWIYSARRTATSQSSASVGNNIAISPVITAGSAIVGQQVSLNGFLICVPPRTVDTSDTSCVIGLETEGGEYYGLVDARARLISPQTVTTGSRTSLSGVIVNNTQIQNKYAVSGVIEINPSASPTAH